MKVPGSRGVAQVREERFSLSSLSYAERCLSHGAAVLRLLTAVLRRRERGCGASHTASGVHAYGGECLRRNGEATSHQKYKTLLFVTRGMDFQNCIPYPTTTTQMCHSAGGSGMTMATAWRLCWLLEAHVSLKRLRSALAAAVSGDARLIRSMIAEVRRALQQVCALTTLQGDVAALAAIPEVGRKSVV